MRTFGIEMETVGVSRRAIADALEGAGVLAVTADYSGRDYSVWQIKNDGSLRHSSGLTAEVVSPILDWDNPESMDVLRNVTSALVNAGVTTNVSCGLHVHMQVDDLRHSGLAWTFMTYEQVQPALELMVSPSRREGRCQWANDIPTDSYSRGILRRDLESFSNPRTNRGVINAGWYAERGTFEFRQRHGSVNYAKILAWVASIASVVETAKALGENDAFPADDWWDGTHRRTISTRDDMLALFDGKVTPFTWERVNAGESVDVALHEFLRLQGLV
jgi:hypothetical protein